MINYRNCWNQHWQPTDSFDKSHKYINIVFMLIKKYKSFKQFQSSEASGLQWNAYKIHPPPPSNKPPLQKCSSPQLRYPERHSPVHSRSFKSFPLHLLGLADGLAWQSRVRLSNLADLSRERSAGERQSSVPQNSQGEPSWALPALEPSHSAKIASYKSWQCPSESHCWYSTFFK